MKGKGKGKREIRDGGISVEEQRLERSREGRHRYRCKNERKREVNDR